VPARSRPSLGLFNHILLKARAQNKASQLAGHGLPTVLAITSDHAFASTLLARCPLFRPLKRWDCGSHRIYSRYPLNAVSWSPMRPSALAAFLIFAATGISALGQAQAASAYKPADQSWVPKSNAYTQTLLDIQNRYSPESASAEGLVQYDTQISDPSFAVQLAKRKEIEAAVAQLIKARATEQNLNVAEDLSILIARQQLNFRIEDYSLAHGSPYINATAYIFGGLQPLLDDQVPQSRRLAAVERLKRYAGIAPGQTTANLDPANAMTAKLLLRANIQLSKPGLYYPTKDEIETTLNRNPAMVDGLQALFVKYHLTGWEPSFNLLKKQLTAYDDWARSTILPHGRSDFRLRSRGLRALARRLRNRHPSGAARRHGAPGVYRLPGPDAGARLPDRATNIIGRRTDYREVVKRVEEEAARRRGHPALLRNASARDRKDHR
jgi:hypothetical protein